MRVWEYGYRRGIHRDIRPCRFNVYLGAVYMGGKAELDRAIQLADRHAAAIHYITPLVVIEKATGETKHITERPLPALSDRVA